jgi:hypothetical protein
MIPVAAALRGALISALRGALTLSARTSLRGMARRRGRTHILMLPRGPVTASPADIVAAMQSPKVRAALQHRAESVAARANTIIDAEGLDTITATVESGTRPKGRPYSRVVIHDGARYEYGTSKTERRRILGRAAESGW